MLTGCGNRTDAEQGGLALLKDRVSLKFLLKLSLQNCAPNPNPNAASGDSDDADNSILDEFCHDMDDGSSHSTDS